MTANLATFVDRYTMRHVRTYPHPVERVWNAITDDQQVSKWFGFPVSFDLRVGGRCAWGPGGNYYETVITTLDPKTLMVHDNVAPGDPGYQRFELEPHPDGCRFNYTQHFEPKDHFEADVVMAGSDQPGGPDTPWRPNFVGGFHSIWDNLGNFLDGAPLERGQDPQNQFTCEVIDNWIWRKTQAEAELSEEVAERYRRELRGVARWNELNEIYLEHIRKTIPKA